ncbi:MAG: LysM peptidoglycan-binding domain-containing protein [Desulfofustis sp.]|nr:LysM peptidoglycan-binding domain-containing protein [Desulfofustis sp.]
MNPQNAIFCAMERLCPTLFYLCVFALCCTTAAMARANPDDFPEYDIMSANVNFWEQVYSSHSVNTSIIHDQHDLGRVYATVSLLEDGFPNARKHNIDKVEQVKTHIRSLLIELSKNPVPATREQRQVAALFGNTKNTRLYKEAADNVRAQRGLKERFAEGVVRSGAYMGELKRIFRGYGLPEDLAYLPHVESSFNPKAFSKFGAAGMWQFTHSTGKQYLTIDYIIDERRDPIVSAHAAAKFLQRNYQQLGSWPLALTAYNYGTAGMLRAQQQEGSYPNIFSNYKQGYFKFASRNFYSEFLAAVKVAKRLERSGMPLEKPLQAVVVRLPAYAHAGRLCTYLGISTATLREYNPALRDPVFKGTKYIPKDYLLKLPFTFNNSRMLASAPKSIFSSSQKRSTFYRVRPGDSAGAIALAHKISLKELIHANNLGDKAFIRVGQNLRIPSNGEANDITVVAAATSGNPILRDTKKLPVSGAGEGFKPDVTVAGNLKVADLKKTSNLLVGTIEVQPDESIGLLADWLKVTPASIRIANNLSGNASVRPGQRIRLDFINTDVSTFEENRFDYHQELQEDFFESFRIVSVSDYRVQPGDTLWELCRKKFDIPLWLLKKYNDTLDYNRLDPSSSLKIPLVKEI